jgi:MFS family permease
MVLRASKVSIAFTKRLQVFMPFAMGYFLSYLYRVINSVLAPNLAADVGVDPSGLGLLTAVYFITFGAFQLPLGVLLDRFGPRKIEAGLLIVAAAGALVFANATTLSGLVVGRGLIGLGVSACLMAAFKAFVLWFPREELPRINGFQMAAGGFGALVGTAPVEAALSVTTWSGVFTVLAVLTLLVAVAIFFIVPERHITNEDQRFMDQLRGIRIVLTSLTFWRIAPFTTLSQATFLSIHGLWAGPWLRDVAGFDRKAAAGVLLWMSAPKPSRDTTHGYGGNRHGPFCGSHGVDHSGIEGMVHAFMDAIWFFGDIGHLVLCRALPVFSRETIRKGQHDTESPGLCSRLCGPVGHWRNHRQVADNSRRGLCVCRLSGCLQHHVGPAAAHHFLVLACRGLSASASWKIGTKRNSVK